MDEPNITPVTFPSMDIKSVEGVWAHQLVQRERQNIKRMRLLEEMVQTGLLEEMENNKIIK